MPVSSTTGQAKARVVIDGVDRYNVPEPLFECVRIVLAQRGERYSTDYLQGISGAAFRISGICPCAPTCSAAMGTQDLIKLLGYECETVVCEGGGWQRGEQNAAARLARMADKGVLPEADQIDDPELKALRLRLQSLIERVKQEVRQGRAVINWNAFTTAEFDVVCGFDDEKKLFIGRGSYAGIGDEYAVAPETRAIETALVGGCPTAILIGRKVGEFDARQAEIAALREGVKHGLAKPSNDGSGEGKWTMQDGIACYTRWASSFAKPDYERGMGDAYCYGIYRRTHRSAAGFLREIAPHHPQAAANLRAAADQFEQEADTLDTAEGLLGWGAPGGADAERNRKTVAILTKARDGYAAGIRQMELALQHLE